jgi:hypothetical protein
VRVLSPGCFDTSLRIESLPLFVAGLFWSIQASAAAESVRSGPQSTAAADGRPGLATAAVSASREASTIVTAIAAPERLR